MALELQPELMHELDEDLFFYQFAYAYRSERPDLARIKWGRIERKELTTIIKKDIENIDHNSTYEGDWIIGSKRRSGWCVRMTRDSNDFYSGFIEEDLFEGRGKYTYSTGNQSGKKCYIGFFKQSEFDGVGLIKYLNGESHWAKWKDNDMTGKGKSYLIR